MQRPDTIERAVTIDAPLERVWGLVTQPGWWIGDGDLAQQRRWREGDLDVVDDPKYGRYLIETVEAEPETRVAFRCAFGAPGEAPDDTNSTLVEFFLTEAGGGVRVRVVESGIAALAAAQGWDDATWSQYVDGNTGGWIEQLDILSRRGTEVPA